MTRITNAERIKKRIPLELDKEQVVIDSATKCCDDGSCVCEEEEVSVE